MVFPRLFIATDKQGGRI